MALFSQKVTITPGTPIFPTLPATMSGTMCRHILIKGKQGNGTGNVYVGSVGMNKTTGVNIIADFLANQGGYTQTANDDANTIDASNIGIDGDATDVVYVTYTQN